MTVAYVALGALIVVNFVLLRSLLDRTEPWNPYEPFPTVEIVGSTWTIQAVTISETRCYRTLPVTQTETISYTRTPGVSILATSAVATISPAMLDSSGCLRQTRRIPIPPAVFKEMDEIGRPTRWHLEGTLTPLRTGTIGKPGTWTSESFELTP